MLGTDEEMDSLFEDIFHMQAKVHKDVFVEVISNKASWAFDAQELRKRIFQAADIEIKHIMAGAFKRGFTS